MKLSEFKTSIADIVKNSTTPKKNVDLIGIGGNDNEDYGDLLVGINHYISADDNINDIKLTNLSKGSDGYGSIVIDGGGGALLLTRMRNAYQYKNKATTSGRSLKMLTIIDKDYDKTKGENEDSDQNIKDVVFGKFQKFAEPSITKGYGSLQATTQSPFAESEDEKTDVLMEEINRIKQLLK